MSLLTATSHKQRQMISLGLGLVSVGVGAWVGNLLVLVLAVAVFELGSFLIFGVRTAPELAALQQFEWDNARKRSNMMGAAVVGALLVSSIGLVVLTRSLDLSGIHETLTKRLADERGVLGFSFTVVVGRLIAVLVGVACATLLGSAPVPHRHWDRADLVSPWLANCWNSLSQLMGLIVVWKIGVRCLGGLELELLIIATAFALLSLLWGAVSLWQREDLQGLLCRIAVVHTGLIWLTIASAIAESVGMSQRLVGGVLLMNCWPAVMVIAVTGVASLVACGIEHGLAGTQQRIQFQDELVGLGRSQPLAGWCLAAALMALTPLPPLAGFWSWFWILGSVFVPGSPTIEQAAAVPNPAVLAALIGAIVAVIPLTYRTMQVVLAMFHHESRGRRIVALDSWSFALSVVGVTGLFVTGLLPSLALTLFSKLSS